MPLYRCGKTEIINPAPVYANYNCACSQALNAVESAGSSLGHLRNTTVTFKIRNNVTAYVLGHKGENCWVSQSDGNITGYIRVANVSATATVQSRSSDVRVLYADDEGEHVAEFNYDGLIDFYVNTMKMSEEEAKSVATSLFDFSDMKDEE